MMAGFFDNVREAFTRWYDALSERERRLVTILFSSVFLILVCSTIFLAMNKLNTRRAELVRNKERYEQVKALESEYLKAKEENERAMMQIRENDVSLFTFIQGITTRFGISVKDLNEQKRPLAKSNIVEISVRLNLTKLSIDRASAILEAIETSDNNLVKVTRLKVNKRFDEPDLLDLQMTVSTWKSS
jgi:hypothetical protein